MAPLNFAMKNFDFVTALAVAAVALSVPSLVFAQEAEPPALVKTREQPAQQIRQRAVKIKNLPSAVVAYMLDPKHNPRPVGWPEADKSQVKGAFDLPDGITQIVSIDPQNVLLVKYGNDEGLRQLRELIDVLDQLLRQVELEAQCVQISLEDAKAFGIEFSRNEAVVLRGKQGEKAPITVHFGSVRGNFTARLNALIADKRAKVLTAPRVTALNNLSATMEMKVDIGTLSDGKRTFTFEPVGAELTITPTINGDDTITLLLNAISKNGEDSKAGAIANLRDGDTIALSGLSPLFAPAGAIDSPNILIFLTARIIRRAGDDINIKVPGT